MSLPVDQQQQQQQQQAWQGQGAHTQVPYSATPIQPTTATPAASGSRNDGSGVEMASLPSIQGYQQQAPPIQYDYNAESFVPQPGFGASAVAATQQPIQQQQGGGGSESPGFVIIPDTPAAVVENGGGSLPGMVGQSDEGTGGGGGGGGRAPAPAPPPPTVAAARATGEKTPSPSSSTSTSSTEVKGNKDGPPEKLFRKLEESGKHSESEDLRARVKDAKSLPLNRENVRAIMDSGMEELLKQIAASLPGGTNPMEVRFQNLSYQAEVPVKGSKIATVGSSFLSMLWPFKRSPTATKHILSDLNGILRPGTITLILGLPQSGKSSLLQALAGNLHVDSKSKLTGDVLLNGVKDAGDFYMPRVVSYVGQTEIHLPVLSVEETLNFARDTVMLDRPEDETIRDVIVDFVLYMTGLYHVKDTPVGNEMIRGVSGGEKRRVTIAEMICGLQPVYCLDEISTGLDSAAAHDIILTFKRMARIMQRTMVTALLQPLPDTLALFDDVILLSQGKIVFHGPVDEAEKHFISLGFIRPPHLDVAEYLLEVTGESGTRLYRPSGSMSRNPPTLDEILAAWKSHPLHQAITAELATPSKYSLPADKLSVANFSTKYALKMGKSTWLVLKRQAKISIRNTAYIRLKVVQSIILGIITGTLFYQMDTSNFQLRYALMFFIALNISLGQMATIPDVMFQKAVFTKQRRANMFSAMPFLLAGSVSLIPILMIESLILSTLAYWLSGLSGDNHGTHFALFWILILVNAIGMGAVVRFFAFVSPTAAIAQTIAPIFLVISAVFAGFMVPRSEIPPWWIWLYWLSPFSWVLRALSINEFDSPKFDTIVPGDGAPMRAGDFYLSTFDMYTESHWIWLSFIYSAGVFVVFSLIGYVLLRHAAFPPPQSTARQEDEERPKSEDLPTTNLPFTPVTFAFTDVSYSVKTKKGEWLRLLNNVSGYAEPGTITALMGSSGAGKTTLLDVLAGRKSAGKVEGQFLVNGYPKNARSFSRMSGYVEQMDIHTPTATVREALMFSAHLRLPKTVSEKQMKEFVDHVIQILELGPIAHRCVGFKDDGGLSTEQAKRLTIAVELVANPSILFLDEPTSGLDARAATVVMRAIRNIAASGRSVVCTIHQPSTELFEMFDRLLLLKRGGETVYFGPMGEHSREVIKYFEATEGAHKCTEEMNPASYMLEVIGAGIGNKAKADFATVYQQSPLQKENEARLKILVQPVEGIPEIKYDTIYARSYWEQFKATFVKMTVAYWRMPQYNFIRVVFLVILALLFGSLYYKNDPSTRAGAFARISVIFISTLFTGVINMNTVKGVIMNERAVFYRERAAGMYSPWVYNLTIGLIEVPYLILNSIVFVTIFYWLAGFKASAANFFYYLLMYALITSMCTYWGHFVACLTPNEAVAQAISPLFNSLWALFCGYFTPYPQIPRGWLFLYWLSPFRYYLEGATVDQFHCDSVQCVHLNLSGTEGSSTMTGDEFVSSSFGMYYSNRWYDVLGVLAFILFFRIGAGMALAYLNHSKR